MTSENLYQVLTALLFVSALAVGIYFRSKAEREGGQMRSNEGSKLVVVLRLLAFVVIAPLLGYLINPQWVAWAQMPLPAWLRGLGAVLATLMIPLIIWMYRAIGHNITPAHNTRQNHQLVTNGPYRWIRHPLYTFGFIFFVGLTCLSALWWLAVTMVVPLIILLLRTPLEEQQLIATFGDDYRQYMQRTGRFFPKL